MENLCPTDSFPKESGQAGMPVLRLVLNPVKLDLRVEGGGFDMQQLGRPRLMTTGLIQGQPDQAALKPLDLAIEINAFGNVESLQPVGFVGEGLVADERLRLLQDCVGEREQPMNTASPRSFSNLELRRRHGGE